MSRPYRAVMPLSKYIDDAHTGDPPSVHDRPLTSQSKPSRVHATALRTVAMKDHDAPRLDAGRAPRRRQAIVAGAEQRV